MCDSVSVQDDLIYRDFGRAVAARRKSQGLTQEQVAAAIGLSRASLANIERGNQKVFLHQIMALSDALGLESTHQIVPSRAIAIASDSNPLANISGAKNLTKDQKAMVSKVANSWALKVSDCG